MALDLFQCIFYAKNTPFKSLNIAQNTNFVKCFILCLLFNLFVKINFFGGRSSRLQITKLQARDLPEQKNKNNPIKKLLLFVKIFY